MEEIIKTIIEVRKELGMSQAILAKDVGLRRVQTISSLKIIKQTSVQEH